MKNWMAGPILGGLFMGAAISSHFYKPEPKNAAKLEELRQTPEVREYLDRVKALSRTPEVQEYFRTQRDIESDRTIYTLPFMIGGGLLGVGAVYLSRRKGNKESTIAGLD